MSRAWSTKRSTRWKRLGCRRLVPRTEGLCKGSAKMWHARSWSLLPHPWQASLIYHSILFQ